MCRVGERIQAIVKAEVSWRCMGRFQDLMIMWRTERIDEGSHSRYGHIWQDKDSLMCLLEKVS